MKNNETNTTEYSRIERHPLRDCYMVICTAINGIPPYFGTLKECKRAQSFLDNKVSDILRKSPCPTKARK